MQVDEHEQQRHEPEQPIQAKPATETLLSFPALDVQIDEEDEDYFSDDPEVIFRREYAKLDTVPLRQKQEVSWPFVCCTVVLFCSLLGGTVLAMLLAPTVTIDLTPISRTVTTTLQLALPTRTLAPVTVTTSAAIPTTGTGHQSAREATGILTFYNGGNIAALDISLDLSNALKVQNTASFQGGRDARDYRAVAKRDLERLTAQLKQHLAQQRPQAFVLRPGEAVDVTTCHSTEAADHGLGEEATAVTMHASETCRGVAYNQNDLQTQAAAHYAQQTRPGTQYQLIGSVSIHLESVAPVIVRCSGYWVYTLSQDYEQFLAQQIVGDTPAQAKALLLRTGVITKATVPGTLPQDPGHIHFQIVVGE